SSGSSRLAIRKPLTAVQELSEDDARMIVWERLTNGRFTSVEDFYRRVPLEEDALRSLARSGAFDELVLMGQGIAAPGPAGREMAALGPEMAARNPAGREMAARGPEMAAPNPAGREMAALDPEMAAPNPAAREMAKLVGSSEERKASRRALWEVGLLLRSPIPRGRRSFRELFEAPSISKADI